MDTTKTLRTWAISAVWVIATAGSAAAITPGQVDDFEDGTTMGWVEGSISPNPPVNVPGGGPGGVDDAYLENTSDGGSLSGGRMVMFNTAQWTGDYSQLGAVPVITADMANLGSDLLLMRIALGGANGARYASSDWVLIDTDSVWYQVQFEISESTMTLVEGTGSLADTLSNVIELRILSSFSPAWRGDRIVGVLGVDNITLSSLEIFNDGFESGDTTAWSSTVP